MHAPLLTMPLLLLACNPAPSVVAGTAFTLQLAPITPVDQDLFTEGAELTVRVWSDADVLMPVDHALGAAADSQWTFPDLDPLDGGRIGLLLTNPGGQVSPDVNYSDLIAYGQTPPLSTVDGSTTTVPVLMAGYARVGTLGTLELSRASYAPAVAALPDGDVLLFGGTSSVLGTQSLAWTHILRLSRDDADLAFTFVDDIPSLPTSDQERVGLTATVVDVDGSPQVFVAGGRIWWTPLNRASRRAFLWDPVEERRAWDGAMFRERSQHAAVAMPDGDVLLIGGYDSGGLADTLDIEWYRHDSQLFDPDPLPLAGLGDVAFAHAAQPELGVLVCGGAIHNGDRTVLSPQPGCKRISPAGAVFPIDSIGFGTGIDQPNRMWHAMAPLGNDRWLLCGGVNQSINSANTAPAVADTYIYDYSDGAWQVVGGMHHPRAMHTAIPLPDGRVLILGGVDRAWGPAPVDLGTPVDIPEIFDPSTNQFLDQPATSVGAGALPAVASVAGHGAFVLAGIGTPADNQLYGVIGLGP